MAEKCGNYEKKQGESKEAILSLVEYDIFKGDNTLDINECDFDEDTSTLRETSKQQENELEISDKDYDEATRVLEPEETISREVEVWMMMRDENLFNELLYFDVETFLKEMQITSQEKDEIIFEDATVALFEVIGDVFRGNKETLKLHLSKLYISKEDFLKMLKQLQKQSKEDELRNVTQNIKYNELKEELEKTTQEEKMKMMKKLEELEKINTNDDLEDLEDGEYCELAKLNRQFLEEMYKLIKLNSGYLQRTRNTRLRKQGIFLLQSLLTNYFLFEAHEQQKIQSQQKVAKKAADLKKQTD